MGVLEKPYFRGQWPHRLDGKGRLRLTNKFREVLQSHYTDALVLTILPDCLVAYPLEIWETVEAKVVEDTSLVQPRKRSFMRFHISSAVVCEFDNQGRILIPPELRKMAGLDQEVVVAGMLTNFEIWSKAAWDNHMEWSKQNYEQIAEEMASLGL